MPLPPKALSQVRPNATTTSGVPVEKATAPSELLFDEADALSSKRSEVRDSHDRYSNCDNVDPKLPKP